MAIVTGRFWEIFISSRREDSKLQKHMRISYWIFVALSLFALAGIYVFIRYEYPQAIRGTLAVESVYASGLLLSAVFFLKKRKLFSFGVIILTVMFMAVPLVNSILPVIEEFETSKAISFKMKELAGTEMPVAGESDNRRGVAFYTDRTDIIDVHPYQDLFDFLSRKEKVWCIIQEKHYDQIIENHPDLASEPVFQTGEKVLITNRP
jgi:hypothetical protein